MNKNVTMSDIAKDMGVSTVTVSKAITGKDGVSEEVRRNILKRADELGYVYTLGNKNDKAIVDKCNIGVLVGENFVNDDTFYAKLYQRISIELTRRGSFGILEVIPWNSEYRAIKPELIVNDKIDGIILLGQFETQYIQMIASVGIPYIFVDFYDDDFKSDAFIGDGEYGAYVLTRYLIEQGHTKIGFIGNYKKTSSILDRYIGYYKAMLKEDLEFDKDWIISDRDNEGRYIDLEFGDNMATAYVCNCDEVAFLAVKKLNELGIKVPDEISIVGFDNFIHAQLCTPKLTTFGVDLDKLVSNAVATMLKKIEKPDYFVGRVVVSGDMVIRDSVASYKSGL